MNATKIKMGKRWGQLRQALIYIADTESDGGPKSFGGALAFGGAIATVKRLHGEKHLSDYAKRFVVTLDGKAIQF